MPAKPRRNPRQANGHRRRQLRAQVLAEEDHCGICGRAVDKTLPPGLPGSPEVDEIIPVSRGGSPYLRENCRLSHRACNVGRNRGSGHQARRHVPPFITTIRRAEESTGATAPRSGDATAHHGHSASDAALRSTGGP